MKKIVPVLATLLLAACGNRPSLHWPDNVVRHHSLHPLRFPLNDSISTLFFEDTIRALEVALYLQSDLQVTDASKQAPRLDAVRRADHAATVVVNGMPCVIQLKNFQPVEQMLPDEVGAFNKGKRHFLAVKMTVVSFIGNVMYYTLALELDQQGKVIHQQGFDTGKELSWKAIKAKL